MPSTIRGLTPTHRAQPTALPPGEPSFVFPADPCQPKPRYGPPLSATSNSLSRSPTLPLQLSSARLLQRPRPTHAPAETDPPLYFFSIALCGPNPRGNSLFSSLSSLSFLSLVYRSATPPLPRCPVRSPFRTSRPRPGTCPGKLSWEVPPGHRKCPRKTPGSLRHNESATALE